MSRKKGRQRRSYAPPRDDATCRVVVTPGALLVSWEAAAVLWAALQASFTLEMGGHTGVQADAAGRVWLVPRALEGPLREWLDAHFAGGHVTFVQAGEGTGAAPPRDPGRASPAGSALADALRTLGVAPGASVEDVRAAYRLLALLYHPDAGGSDTQMATLNAAYALVTAHLGR